MTQRPSDGFGARLAYYRKLSGLSAERLSQRVPISRAVISNIENGRKRDITIDEMLALAWALDIPPVALALPLEQPNVFIETARGEARTESARAHSAIDWFITGKKPGSAASPQQMIAMTRLRMLRDYYSSRSQLTRAETAISKGDQSANWAAIVEEQKSRLRDLTEELTGLGIDLTYYKIDETGLPDGDD
ncbi:helix-turn-helix domain-containing protein [Microbacterium sp. MMO-113]|uniref:helix-turn-helix domain-containing protein n=1 Tax=Microbacterium sp. MMO-113 TaxID=3081273 RepID=UPI003015B979